VEAEKKPTRYAEHLLPSWACRIQDASRANVLRSSAYRLLCHVPPAHILIWRIKEMTMPYRGRDEIERTVRALYWVDDDGNRVQEVSDRFQARYVFLIEETGEPRLERTPFSVKGVSGTSIRDIAALGFATEEYLALIKYEAETFDTIKSEEELDELLPRSGNSFKFLS
jgi:hypothetical protein